MTFIGYKQTDKQTNKQTDKPNLYIDVKPWQKKNAKNNKTLQPLQTCILRQTDGEHIKSGIIYPPTSPSAHKVGNNVSWENERMRTIVVGSFLFRINILQSLTKANINITGKLFSTFVKNDPQRSTTSSDMENIDDVYSTHRLNSLYLRSKVSMWWPIRTQLFT